MGVAESVCVETCVRGTTYCTEDRAEGLGVNCNSGRRVGPLAPSVLCEKRRGARYVYVYVVRYSLSPDSLACLAVRDSVNRPCGVCGDYSSALTIHTRTRARPGPGRCLCPNSNTNAIGV